MLYRVSHQFTLTHYLINNVVECTQTLRNDILSLDESYNNSDVTLRFRSTWKTINVISVKLYMKTHDCETHRVVTYSAWPFCGCDDGKCAEHYLSTSHALNILASLKSLTCTSRQRRWWGERGWFGGLAWERLYCYLFVSMWPIRLDRSAITVNIQNITWAPHNEHMCIVKMCRHLHMQEKWYKERW